MHFPHFKARIPIANSEITGALRALFLLTATLLITSAAWAQYRGSITGHRD